MNFFIKHTTIRILSILLTLILVHPDISVAFTSHTNVKQNLATEIISQPEMLNTDAPAQDFKQSILSEKDLLGSLLTIGQYLLGDPDQDAEPLPLEYLDYVMTAELKEALKNIDVSQAYYGDGSIFIPYRKDNTACFIEVAFNKGPADKGYKASTEKYALKIHPYTSQDIAGETDPRTIARLQDGLRNDPGITDHAVMLFKMGLPEPVRKRTIKYLHEKCFGVARVGRVDEAIGMDTMLFRWGKGAGIEFSVNNIEKDGVPVTEAREALEKCDGKKFEDWFNDIYSNKEYSDLSSVKELKYFIECFNRGIEMVIVRSRVSRKELAKNFGIEYTEDLEKMSFQDLFKRYIVGKTNSFEADPRSLRGHIIGPALAEKNGELQDLYARGVELGIPHKIIGLIATGIHCPKAGPEIDKEINDYFKPQKPVLSGTNNVRIRMEDMGNYLTGFLRNHDGWTTDLENIDRSETTYEMKKSFEAALDNFSSLKGYLSKDERDITDIPDDIQEAVDYLRDNMDKFEVNGLLSAIITLARKAKREGQKLVIGLEADWIPGLMKDRSMQKTIIDPLIKVIGCMEKDLKAMGIDNVMIVSGNKDNLAGTLLNAADTENVSFSNMVVLASKDTIISPGFNPLRSSPGKTGAFLAGVDARKLLEFYDKHADDPDKQLDIDIIGMLSVALELAMGKEYRDIPLIDSYDRANRTVIFLPDIEPVNYLELFEANKNKKRVLSAA